MVPDKLNDLVVHVWVPSIRLLVQELDLEESPSMHVNCG